MIKIISGGQTGADMGGLEAAREYGFPTGGYAPKGWMTERGRQEELLRSFGLVESDGGYVERTDQNVALADLTIIFGNVNSTGSALTRVRCFYRKKECVCISETSTLRALMLAETIASLSPKIINIAGNRESRNPGIQADVRRFLALVFSRLINPD
jgi:hypothetical protein